MVSPLATDWKGQQQNYDDLLATADRSFVFCLSERTAKMLLAFAQPLHWTTRYFSETSLEIDADLVDEWASQLEGELITGMNQMCGCTPVGGIVRVNGEGVLEISYDGGETWSPAPNLDPRETSTRFPPLSGEDGDDKRCTAARNARAYMESWVEQLADVLDAGGLVVAAITEIIAVFLSGGALLALAAPLGGILISLGGSALRAAFTSDIWDDVQCCLKDAVSADGTFSSSGWESVKACVLAQPGSSGTILWHIVTLLGAVGLSNVAASGTGGETDCDCGECDPAFALSRMTWAFSPCTGPAFDVTGTRCNDGGFNRWALDNSGTSYIQIDMGDRHGTEVTEVIMSGPFIGSGHMVVGVWVSDVDGVLDSGTRIMDYETNPALQGDTWVPVDVLATGQYLRFQWESGSSLLTIGGGGASTACP